ncbi:hypothetical protein LCGC14_0371850 [marine sediment metagenome]|uniref:Ribbon-helix-helix protein CopG domain-containing protein n=1 Tax=marine sediment metagenome TaxID=412755 RepID=A0A0F9WDP2_9ZZZZ
MPTTEYKQERPKKKQKLINITLNIPNQYYDAIKILIGYNLTQSRSAFIRQSLKDFLKKYLPHYKDLEEFHKIIVHHPELEERRRHPKWRALSP